MTDINKDLIRRTDVITAINNYYNMLIHKEVYDKYEENEEIPMGELQPFFKANKEICKKIRGVPTFENPIKDWIPVSSGRLPEDNKMSEYYDPVIVTLDNGRVTDGCYRNRDKEWWVDALDGHHYSVDATGHVIAWMPLPEPYKGD